MKKILTAIAASFILTAFCGCSMEVMEDDLSSESSDVEEAEETSAPTSAAVFTGIPDAVTRPAAASEAVQTETEAAPETETSAEETAPEPQQEQLASEETGAPPEGVKCLESPYIEQGAYSTGCELVCASMLLAYYDFQIAPYDLISEGYVGTGSVHEDFMNPGTFYGADPNKVFIGDPNDIHNFSYGCYSGAILEGLKKYLDKEFFDAVDISGISLKDLCMEYIDCGEPVLIWATVGMEEPFSEDNNKWFIEDTGEEFSWISKEHCFMLVGYNEEFYCFHDPLGGAYTLYPREVCEQRYKELGCQAITIHPW